MTTIARVWYLAYELRGSLILAVKLNKATSGEPGKEKKKSKELKKVEKAKVQW